MTAYKEYSPDYIPRIIQECVNRNYRIDLRTNALWTEDNTVNQMIWQSLDNIDFSKYTNKISFSLSIDRFHNNETANQNLISRICNSDLGKHFEFTAYLIPDNSNDDNQEFGQIYARLIELVGALSNENGVEITEMATSKIPQRYNTGVYLNNIPFLVEAHNFGRWGRAKEFGIGSDETDLGHVMAQFNVIQIKQDYEILDKNSCAKQGRASAHFIFSSDGMADFIVPVQKETAGVPWRDGDRCKPLAQLYPEMVEHLRTRFDTVQKLYPQITPESVALPYILKTLSPER